MKTRFTALMLASLAGVMFSGQVMAAPRFLDGDWLAAREEREYGRQEEREARKRERQAERKRAEKHDSDEREHGYGYGYERRSQRPQQPDDRRRR